MYSKLLVCVLVGVAVASPEGYGSQQGGNSFGGPLRGSSSRISSISSSSGPVVPILRDDRQGPDQFGAYSFNFETGDGISRQEEGIPQGPNGAVVQTGGWSFTFPDGTPAVFKFVADENGYRVESDLLPTPPPLPPHAIAQIERARQEDAAAAASGHRGSFAAPSAPAPQFARPSTQYGAPSDPASHFASPSAPALQFVRPSTQYGAPSAPASQFASPSAPAPQFASPSAPSRTYGFP